MPLLVELPYKDVLLRVMGYEYACISIAVLSNLTVTNCKNMKAVSTPVPALNFILAGSYGNNNVFFPITSICLVTTFITFKTSPLLSVLRVSLTNETHLVNKLTLSCLQIVLLLSKILLLLLMQLLEFALGA